MLGFFSRENHWLRRFQVESLFSECSHLRKRIRLSFWTNIYLICLISFHASFKILLSSISFDIIFSIAWAFLIYPEVQKEKRRKKRRGKGGRTPTCFISSLLFQVISRQIWEINLHTEFAQSLHILTLRFTPIRIVQQWNRTPQSLFWKDFLQHQRLSVPQDHSELERVREIWLQIQVARYCTEERQSGTPLNYLHLCDYLYGH